VIRHYCHRCRTPGEAFDQNLPKGWDFAYTLNDARKLCPLCLRAEREHAWQTRPVEHPRRASRAKT
jgi:hypothetical protein